MNILSVSSASLVFLGLSAGAEERPLPFLGKIKEFSDFSLSITEAELKSKIARRGLYSDRTVNNSKMVNYWLLTEGGENVNVMFRVSGECSGIQRMRPIPKSEIRKQIGDARYAKWEADRRKLQLTKERGDKEVDAKRERRR